MGCREECFINPKYPDIKCCFNCDYGVGDCDVLHVCGEDCPHWIPKRDMVEVKHGEWVEVNQVGRNSRHIKYTTKQCSVCGYCNGRRKTNYCPNCGAKMDKEEGAEE